jgi:glyoxylase-like metal-dependent hydrolase (beta-lactamase superfamily II)
MQALIFIRRALATKSLDLGRMKVHILDDGMFITNAGSILGGKSKAKIKGGMHPVLVETPDGLTLLDAGFGPELPESLREDYELQRERSLLDYLSELGHAPQDITHVVLSHLDADHVGWALNGDRFPRAQVLVQEAALEEARSLPDHPGRSESVPAIERGIEEGWCELVSGEGEIAPGIRVELRSGHAAGHQISWIGTGRAGETALFTGDLAPSKIFLDPNTISGVDTDPEAARQNRIEVLTEAVERDAPVILYHEPNDSLVKLSRTEKGFEGSPYGG